MWQGIADGVARSGSYDLLRGRLGLPECQIMPFIVECPYCGLRGRLPDRAEGGSGKCPRCSNSFTLVPAEDQRAPVSAARESAETDLADTALEARTSTAVATAIAEATEAAAEADAAAEQLACAEEAAPETEAPNRSPARVQPATLAGTAALLCGGIGLLCASVPALCLLVVPLSTLGLLGGQLAIALACNGARRQRRLLVPITGSAVCSLLLFLALACPSLLGPTYLGYSFSRQAAAPPAAMRAIPLGAAPVLTEVPDWTNAGQYALQQGELRLQVVGISMAPASDGRKAAPDLLHVRIRVTLAARPAGRDAKPIDFADNRRQRPFDGSGPTPALADGAGKLYSVRDSKIVESVGGKRRADLFPIHSADEVLVFDAPPMGSDPLQLEVPGEAWGAAGKFRFAIPASLLNQQKEPRTK
jgi:hypothetical protein